MKNKLFHRVGMVYGLIFTIVLLGIHISLTQYFHTQSPSFVDKSFAEIQSAFQTLDERILVVLFTAFAAFMFMDYGVALYFTKRMTHMVEAANRMAAGNFSRQFFNRSNDEVGDLAAAFNHIADQVRDRIEEDSVGRSRLEAVLLSMFEGLLVVDGHGGILLMNQSLRDVLQIQEDPIGKRPLAVIRNIEVQDLITQAQKLDQGVLSREITLLLPDEKIMLVHAAPVNRAGSNEGQVLVFHDITDLRRLERVRKEFVTNVSHELRTPLASIKGYSETLLEGALEDQAHAKEFLKIIYADSERLAKLVDDLLSLSRIEAGKLGLEFKEVLLEPLVDAAFAGLAFQAREKKVQLKKEIPPQLKVCMDESSIMQVLMNLVENAVKYNREGGSVKVSARRIENSIVVDVVDTGIGIPEEDQPRIFERFYRVDKARSRDLGGTGLGLSIVKHIVLAHKGTVSLRSEQDKGSTFSFTLPQVIS